MAIEEEEIEEAIEEVRGCLETIMVEINIEIEEIERGIFLNNLLNK